MWQPEEPSLNVGGEAPFIKEFPRAQPQVINALSINIRASFMQLQDPGSDAWAGAAGPRGKVSEPTFLQGVARDQGMGGSCLSVVIY
jgi:hypothetical protein